MYSDHHSTWIFADRDSNVFTAGVVCAYELYHIECMAVAQSASGTAATHTDPIAGKDKGERNGRNRLKVQQDSEGVCTFSKGLCFTPN